MKLPPPEKNAQATQLRARNPLLALCAGPRARILAALVCFATAARAQLPSSFLVSKGQLYLQTSSSAAPAPATSNSAVFDAEANGLGGPPIATGATLTLPSGAIKEMAYDTASGNFEFIDTAATPSALGGKYPSGVYGISVASTFLPDFSGNISLPVDSYPSAPVIGNYPAAQTIDPNQDFTLTFQSFGGVAPDDASIEVDDSTGTPLITDSIGLADTSYTISAGTLSAGTTYQAHLRFRHVQVDLSSFPTPGFGFFADTQFALTTSGASEDHTPPVLASFFPTNGTALPTFNASVVFQFSKPMSTNIDIRWSATSGGSPVSLAPANFLYLWTPDGQTLACNYATFTVSTNPLTGQPVTNPATGQPIVTPNPVWPPGLEVSWMLNPTAGAPGAFSDAAGNALATGTFGGSFLTAGGPWECPAQMTNQVEAPGFYVAKILNNRQTGPGAPEPDPVLQAQFVAYLRDALSVTTPGIDISPLCLIYVPTATPHQFRVLPLLESFSADYTYSYRLYTDRWSNSAALDAAYLGGSYPLILSKPSTVSVTNLPTVTASNTLAVGVGGYPAAPHFSNVPALQTLSASNDFNVSWDAFTGAAPETGFVTLQVLDGASNVVFSAPNACKGVNLAPSSTSVTIPGGTLSNGLAYTFVLTFGARTDSSKSLQGVLGAGYAALESTTRLALSPGGAPVITPPQILSMRQAGSGGWLLQLTCTAATPLVIERTTVLGGPFSPLITTNPPGPLLSVSVPGGPPNAFYRARNP